MSAQRALLNLFGVLDFAATNAPAEEVREQAKRLVPGDPDNTGWFAELDRFMFPNDAPQERPDLDAALEQLRSANLSVAETGRMVYAAGAIQRLESVGPPIAGGLETSSGAPVSDLMDEVLALALPLGGFDSGEGLTAEAQAERIAQMRSVFVNKMKSYREWATVAPELGEKGLIDPLVATVQIEEASVVPIDGIPSVVVDTEFASTLASLDDLKAVVDPRNWAQNYPDFFCEMVGTGLRADGWRGVMETVGVAAVPGSTRLRTHLKFFKHVSDDGHEASLDYDMSLPADGDGRIIVDRGFINMLADKSPDLPGVVVRTRKVAHITGVRPETQRRFVFIFGYTCGAKDMLIGSALRFQAGAEADFYSTNYYPWEDVDDRVPSDASMAPESDRQRPTWPAMSSNSAMTKLFEQAVDTTQFVSGKNMDLADLWMSGQLTFQDIATYGTEVSARLVSDPWRYLDAITKPRGENS